MKNDPDVEPGPNITLLKWIVGILGFLIILFIGIIGVTLYNRMTAPKSVNPPAASEIPQPAPQGVTAGAGAAAIGLRDFGDIAVAIPEDMDVISLTSDGARMFLTLGTEGAARRILVFSLADGHQLGSFSLDRTVTRTGE